MEKAEEKKSKNNKRIWTPLFTGILFVAFVSLLAGQMQSSGLPIYFNNIGVSATLGGLQVFMFAISAAFGRLIGGVFSDGYSRRNVMLFGLALFLLSCSMPLVFNDIWMILVSRSIQGISFAITSTATATAITDILPPARLGEGIGYYGLSQSLPMAVGPMIALPILNSNSGFPYMLYIFISTAVGMAFIISIFCRYENPEQIRERRAARPESIGKRLIDKRCIGPSLIMMLSCVGLSIVNTFAAMYGVELGLSSPGMIYLISSVTMIGVRLFCGRLIDHMRPLPLLLFSLAFCAIGLLTLAFCRGMIMFCLAGVGYGLGHGMLMPLLNSVAVRHSDPSRFGAANATFYFAVDVGFGTGSVLWGAVAEYSSYSMAFTLSATMIAIVAICGLIMFRREPAPDNIEN